MYLSDFILLIILELLPGGEYMENNKDTTLEMTGTDAVRNRIYTIRGVQVMLDSDLAELYGYETKNLNRQVKNNIEKFPEDMMFQLNEEEVERISRCKNFTSIMQTKGIKGGRTSMPYAFTEQGIYMLMTVLKGELAVKQSKMLIRLFKQMRQYLSDNALVFNRLDKIEMKQLEADKKFETIFRKLEEPRQKKAVLFFRGQMFDAFSCIADIIRTAEKEIILIDGYTDTATLDLLSKKKEGVEVKIYTSEKYTKLTESEIASFNKEYPALTVKYTTEFHDRFMILDRKTLYHVGASIKDAGKKAFEISEIDDGKQTEEILRRL